MTFACSVAASTPLPITWAPCETRGSFRGSRLWTSAEEMPGTAGLGRRRAAAERYVPALLFQPMNANGKAIVLADGRGNEQRIRKILGLNWLRVIRAVTEKKR